jgi:menaquinone-dependent protoporphyrinogen oxidase
MKVLVAYATRHGSTAGIAEHIAAELANAGIDAEARPAAEVSNIEGFDAVVLGGAAYMFHWHKDAKHFAQRHAAMLAARPLWLFASGPIGTDLVNKQGVDQLVACRPKEFDGLVASLKPRGEKVFFGAYDPSATPIGLAEKIFAKMPVAREELPAGDFRDWPTIGSWADGIASALRGDA